MYRYVTWVDYERNEKGSFDKKEMGAAKFHQFGVGYEEFETGPGNYSTAILELADGTVKNVPVENIKFMK